MKFSWFLLRVALLAWLFMLLLPAVDHSYSVLLLAADAILICAFLVDRESRPAVVRAIASASILLVLWGLFIWHSAWLPPFALLLFDIFQRFVWDATALNVQDRWHSNRLAFFQGLILLSLAVLVLDHGAVHAYFATDEFSKVSDRVGISVISMLWLVQLVVAEIRQTTGARIAGEGAPVSAA